MPRPKGGKFPWIPAGEPVGAWYATRRKEYRDQKRHNAAFRKLMEARSEGYYALTALLNDELLKLGVLTPNDNPPSRLPQGVVGSASSCPLARHIRRARGAALVLVGTQIIEVSPGDGTCSVWETTNTPLGVFPEMFDEGYFPGLEAYDA